MNEPDDLDLYIAELMATNPEFAQRWLQYQAELWSEDTRVMWSGTLPSMRKTAKDFKMSVRFFARPRPQYLIKPRKTRNRR